MSRFSFYFPDEHVLVHPVQHFQQFALVIPTMVRLPKVSLQWQSPQSEATEKVFLFDIPSYSPTWQGKRYFVAKHVDSIASKRL